MLSCAPTLTPLPATLDAAKVPAPKDYKASLLALMGSPDLASKAWIWHQYDHLIMGNTAIRVKFSDAGWLLYVPAEGIEPATPKEVPVTSTVSGIIAISRITNSVGPRRPSVPRRWRGR